MNDNSDAKDMNKNTKATITPLIPAKEIEKEDSLDLIDFMTLLYEREHI